MTDGDQLRITPVILSGGAGTRLWPWSRHDTPKQFLHLTDAQSLLQATALRTTGPAFNKAIILTNTDYADETIAQLETIKLRPDVVICEPASRNTAPAIALSALFAAATNPETLLLVLPSDHLISDTQAFHQAILTAIPAAQAGRICTFGITPDYPETGYGYIEIGDALIEGVHDIRRFIEKPDKASASTYIKQKRFVWNSGIFLFRAGDLINALRTYAPDVLTATQQAMDQAVANGLLLHPETHAFQSSPSISIDYAVMEKSNQIAVTPVDMGWSDIGSWDALDRLFPQLGKQGDIVEIATENCFLHSQGPLIATIGVKDLIVIAMDDAVLIAPKGSSQDVRAIVSTLKKTHHTAINHSPRRAHHWGSLRQLTSSALIDVHEATIRAGQSMSLPTEKGSTIDITVMEGRAVIDNMIYDTAMSYTAIQSTASNFIVANDSTTQPLKLVIIHKIGAL